ncbi:hypothetical protein C5167_039825 [Papaver somniferum]|uniref:MATH domain-containing protein n=1 Tax=Papaver somniferum TaxID=3469 RepID=A0A4Y7IGS2_PAPSO|nr:uncharacterized protein LOC113334926 [Papaver somniferum]RZC46892.1 hypothetical protein C5167_039825 [Papaver somniferum]
MSTSGSSIKIVWKIENLSSLSDITDMAHYSQAFYRWGVYWQLGIELTRLQHGTYESSRGEVTTRNETRRVIGLSTLDKRRLYVKYSLAIVNQKCEEQTRRYDMEREIWTENFTLYEAVNLTELLDPGKGFIIDDICYIKVEIFSALNILKSIRVKPETEPEPAWGNWGNFFQALIGAVIPSGDEVTQNEETTDSREKEDIPGSVETTTQAAGGSKSASDKNPGENQNTETKDEERSLSLSRLFQEQKQDIGNYFNDDSGYQRLQ